MCTVEFQNVLVEINHQYLIEPLKSDQHFRQNLSECTIDQLGDRFLPETIDGAVFNYAVRPKYWE